MIMTVPHTLPPLVSRVLCVTKKYIVTPFKAILRALQRTRFFTLDQWFSTWCSFAHPTPRGHLALSKDVFYYYNTGGLWVVYATGV